MLGRMIAEAAVIIHVPELHEHFGPAFRVGPQSSAEKTHDVKDVTIRPGE